MAKAGSFFGSAAAKPRSSAIAGRCACLRQFVPYPSPPGEGGEPRLYAGIAGFLHACVDCLSEMARTPTAPLYKLLSLRCLIAGASSELPARGRYDGAAAASFLPACQPRFPELCLRRILEARASLKEAASPHEIRVGFICDLRVASLANRSRAIRGLPASLP